MGNENFSWGNDRRYYSYTEYIRKIFGERIQKVAVDAGFTCPNRDGTLGTGGCTYCDNEAFNPSYCRPEKTIGQQIEEGIGFHAKRYRRASRFLVYFQPYSNTYASIDILRKKYGEALSFPAIAGLVIGTRPDCVDDEKLAYLAELAKKHFIQVEYGVETTNEETLTKINRGHTFAQSREIIEKTSSMGIRTGAHFIFGLPGETPEMMNEMAKVISSLPIDTVKFHQLQVIKGTVMEQQFLSDPSLFHSFSLEEYIGFIVSFTERLNPSIAIERFTGEVPPRFIQTNNWGLLRNDVILRMIEKEFEKRNSWQGKNFS
jgi:uncharacterized protein